ncbi:MAG: hypothetical protein QNK35_17160 [Bacteroides sp.]|nr:hypothetical protein [Bacteroides sp.]
MKGSISERIIQAEEQWLEPVQAHVAKLFGSTFIPSHDQGHSMRVWEICKNLLLKMDGPDLLTDQGLAEGLLLASWFHDTGMVRDPGEKHGAYSKDVFEAFLGENGLNKPHSYHEILKVIETHDTKECSLYSHILPGKNPEMMGILSIADDLDALGFVGIYRYSEIYLKRGIPSSLLGLKILTNVRKRFNNILNSCAAFPALIDSYRKDFHLIERFFNRYNQHLLLSGDAEKVLWGELGIVNHIRAYSVEAEIRPEDFMKQAEVADSGTIVKTYFKRLHDELEIT